jgi:acyl dehydratase
MHDSYEAVTPGETVDLGSCEVTREEIRSFAQRYDPQEFHLEDDPEGPFGGLVASGWHTVSLTMRLLVEGYLREASTAGSPGVEGLRWREPVRPGDELTATLRLGEKESWDESRGLVHHELETDNQHGDRVLWVDALALYPRES